MGLHWLWSTVTVFTISRLSSYKNSIFLIHVFSLYLVIFSPYGSCIYFIEFICWYFIFLLISLIVYVKLFSSSCWQIEMQWFFCIFILYPATCLNHSFWKFICKCFRFSYRQLEAIKVLFLPFKIIVPLFIFLVLPSWLQ